MSIPSFVRAYLQAVTIRLYHDVVQDWLGLSYVRRNQEPASSFTTCTCATAVLIFLDVACCLLSNQTNKQAVNMQVLCSTMLGKGVQRKLCPAKYIIHRMVRFVRALDHIPLETNHH